LRLLIIRHAVAEDREEFAASGRDDALRPITPAGKWKMQRATKGLRRVAPTIDVLASSPLVRAAQTAEIISRAYGGVEVETVPALAPEGRPTAFLRWLRAREAESTVAVVGHEPHLGQLVGWLLSGQEGSWIALKKGSACLLEFEGRPHAGGAMLLWALTPGQLRRLGD
jgi:phosphohistidine phosphatase